MMADRPSGWSIEDRNEAGMARAADIQVRKEGRAGRITLDRPQALNALTWEMCLAIEAALEQWRGDSAVDLVMIDAAGGRAFCAGGDIQEMYATGRRGDFGYGQRFWRDEYRMNAMLFGYPKPVVTFLHGFVMGGGVGVGCHASHRIVDDSSRIALPEVSIGLVPDVGSSLILARAPGRLGEYLGLTGDRMAAGCAIYAGFADHYVPRDGWDRLKRALCNSGDAQAVVRAARPAPDSRLAAGQRDLDAVFGRETLGDIWRAQRTDPPEALAHAFRLMARGAPLSQHATLELIRTVRACDRIEQALDHEFRFTARAMEHGDFLEGIRAAVIDRDGQPKWRHSGWENVPEADILRMTEPVDPPLNLP